VLNVGIDNNFAVATWTDPTATDNYGPATLTSTHQSSGIFSIGQTTVV
jgi:hypothetical protein